MRKIDDINWKNKDFCKELFQSKGGGFIKPESEIWKIFLKKGGFIKQGVFIKQYKVYRYYLKSDKIA